MSPRIHFIVLVFILAIFADAACSSQVYVGWIPNLSSTSTAVASLKFAEKCLLFFCSLLFVYFFYILVAGFPSGGGYGLVLVISILLCADTLNCPLDRAGSVN